MTVASWPAKSRPRSKVAAGTGSPSRAERSRAVSANADAAPAVVGSATSRARSRSGRPPLSPAAGSAGNGQAAEQARGYGERLLHLDRTQQAGVVEPLQQQCPVIDGLVDQTDGAVAVPSAQSGHLVAELVVEPRDLEHVRGAALPDRDGDPVRSVHRGTVDAQRPTRTEVGNERRQRFGPYPARFAFGRDPGVGEERRRQPDQHRPILADHRSPAPPSWAMISIAATVIRRRHVMFLSTTGTGATTFQPALHEDQVDDPAAPDARLGGGLDHGRLVAVVVGGYERRQHDEPEHQPQPVHHDRQRQGEAAEHPPAVLDVPPPTRHPPAGDGEAQPHHGQHRVSDPSGHALQRRGRHDQRHQPGRKHSAEHVRPPNEPVHRRIPTPKPRPHLQAAGHQRHRPEQDVGDQGRVVQREPVPERQPRLVWIEGQIRRQRECQESDGQHGQRRDPGSPPPAAPAASRLLTRRPPLSKWPPSGCSPPTRRPPT